VSKCRGSAPLPERQHEIALDAFRAWRRGRHLTRGDAIGPIREHRERGLATERPEGRDHRGTVLTHLRTVIPRVVRRLENTEPRRKLAGREIAKLMAHVAARLDLIDPVVLRGHSGLDAVAGGTRARELRLLRHLNQRVPVVGRVNLCRRARVGRDQGL
jgi:hypothetical protein